MSTEPINVNTLRVDDFTKEDRLVIAFITDGKLFDGEKRFVSIGVMRFLQDGTCLTSDIEMKQWTETPEDALAVMKFTMDALERLVGDTK